jgi:CheY-like chemotaxis protein
MTEKRNAVLFVDDEQHILTAIRRATIDEPFDALFAGSGATALQALEEREISVIVTDMRMPVMDGLTLLKQVREKYPATVRVVLSGYTQLSQVLSSINQGEIFQFIPKPWKMEEELLWTVRRAVERYNIETERNVLQASLAKKNAAYVHILQEMSQKLANERRDISGFKNISRWTLNFWKERLSTCLNASAGKASEVEEQFRWVEKIQNAYMDILPTVFEIKEFKQLAAEMRLAAAGRVQFLAEADSQMLLGGCFDFARMLFKTLLELHGADKEETVAFTVLNKPQDGGGKGAVVFESIPAPAMQEQQRTLEIAYSLLDAIGQPYGFVLLPQTENGRIAKVRVGWQLQPQKETTTGLST